MADRTVSVKLKADVADYMAKMRAAGQSTQDLEKASRDLRGAMRDEEDATGRVRVAQAKLDEARKDSKTTVSQLARAEEDLASAHRKLEQAQERTAEAQQKYVQTQETIGKEAGEAFGRGYEQETSKVAKRANAQFAALLAAGLAAGGGAAAGVGALISAAAVAGTTAAILGIGVAALHTDEQVVAAWADMKRSVAADSKVMAQPLKGELITSIDRLRGAFHDMAPELRQDIAAAVPALDHLTSGGINMVRAMLPGIRSLATTSEPTFRGLQHFLEDTGVGFTQFANRVASSSNATEHDLEALGQLVEHLFGSLGGIVSNLASNTRAVDVFTQLIAEAAHTLELLTANGGAAMSILTGFGGTMTGLLHILNGLLGILNLLPSGMSEFIGMLIAGMLIARQFGFSIGDAFTKGGAGAEGFKAKVGAAIAILTVLGAAARLMSSDVQYGQTTVDGLSSALSRWAATGRASGDLAKLFGSNLKDMGDAFTIVNERGFSKFLENTTDVVGNLIGVDSRLDDAKSRVKQLDDALASMVRNNQGQQASEILQKIAQQTGLSMDDLRKLLPGYAAAQSEAANSTKNTAATVQDLGQRAKTAAAHITALLESLNNLVQPELDARSAARELEKAIDDATGAVKENGRNLDITSEKGRNNQAALDGIASSTNGLIQAMVKSGASQRDVAAKMDEGRNAFINTATAMGMTRSQAEHLATQLGLISSKDWQVIMGANVGPARDQVTNFLAFADAQSATAKVFGDTGPALGAVKDWQNVTTSTEGTATVYAYTDPATGAVTKWKINTDATGATTTTYSFTDPATGKVYEWQRFADGTWGTVHVGADTGPANSAIDWAARDRTATIYIHTVDGTTTGYATGPGGVSTGGRFGPRAAGGIDIPSVVPMARGGISGMAHLATVVQPGTLRLIGDNMRVPEAFIPLDPGSARSQKILDTVNTAMGRDDVVRHVIRSGAATQAPAVLMSSSSTVNNFNFPNYIGSRDELVRAIRAHVWKASGGNVQKALGR